MPIYAFECTACGHAFDRLQKLSDADPTDCPECGMPYPSPLAAGECAEMDRADDRAARHR